MSTKMAWLISGHDYKMTRSTLSFFFFLHWYYKSNSRKPIICELMLHFYILRILGYQHI